MDYTVSTCISLQWELHSVYTIWKSAEAIAIRKYKLETNYNWSLRGSLQLHVVRAENWGKSTESILKNWNNIVSAVGFFNEEGDHCLNWHKWLKKKWYWITYTVINDSNTYHINDSKLHYVYVCIIFFFSEWFLWVLYWQNK